LKWIEDLRYFIAGKPFAIVTNIKTAAVIMVFGIDFNDFWTT